MSDQQDHPVQDGAQEASDDLRLRGLLDQLRADAVGHNDAQIEKLLRTRLADTGIELDEEEIARLADELRRGA
jgi:hypothetical protein